MQVNDKDLTLIAVGAAFAVLVVFVAHNESGMARQQRYEQPENPNHAKVIDALDTGSHYFHPAYCVPGQTVIFTAHRYPVASSPGITALIHHGITAMSRPAPQDDDWRTAPPGDMAW